MFYNGKPAVGIALSMKSGGNNLKLGENLKKLQDSVKADLPAGMEMNQVSDQPQIVKESISDLQKRCGKPSPSSSSSVSSPWGCGRDWSSPSAFLWS